MKLVSLHVMVPHNVKRQLQAEARKAGIPLSIYVRKMLMEIYFMAVAKLQEDYREPNQKT